MSVNCTLNATSANCTSVTDPAADALFCDPLENPVWACNSAILGLQTVTDMSVAYGLMAVSVAVLIHSAYMRGKLFPVTRIWTDVAATCCFFSCICLLQCKWSQDCSITKTGVLNNVLGLALFGSPIQIADNYLVFNRWTLVAGVDNISKLHKALACTYVFFLLFFNWIPPYTVLPFWYDMNSDYWANMQLIVSGKLYFAAYIVYDVFYLGWLSYLLYINEQASASTQSLKVYDLSLPPHLRIVRATA